MAAKWHNICKQTLVGLRFSYPHGDPQLEATPYTNTKALLHTNLHTWLYADTPLDPWKPNYTQREREKRKTVHCYIYEHTVIQSPYIKLSTNGHLRVLLIQCTVAPALSLLHWPFFRPVHLFCACTDDYCPCRRAVKSVSVAGVGLGALHDDSADFTHTNIFATFFIDFYCDYT